MIDENEEYPKISIVTVVFNGARTLEQTILSVVEQTYKNIEYIIIDGGSTDGTIDIIEKYEDRIAYWVSEPDRGIYDAMNKGIDIATGEWIYFIGADDCLVDRNTIQEIFYDFNLINDVISGNVWSVDERSKMQHIYSNNFKNSIEEDFKNGNIKAHHQALFVKKNLAKLLKFDINYKIGADYKFLLQLWTNPRIKIKKITNIVAFFSNQGISNIEISKRNYEHSKIIEELGYSEFDFKRFLIVNKKSKLKEFIKYLLQKMYLLNYIRTYNGWKIHKCSWNKCRWCK